MAERRLRISSRYAIECAADTLDLSSCVRGSLRRPPEAFFRGDAELLKS